jgi:uncharacterized repeat protein (TIGR01451 family)
MFGRLLSYIKTMGTGSMRKRLYTRLAGGAALLVLTVFAIAQAQRMSADRRAAVAAQVDDGSGEIGSFETAAKQSARTPQPIPDPNDDDSPVALKPPSTFGTSGSSRDSYNHFATDDEESASIPGDGYRRPDPQDGYATSVGDSRGAGSRFSSRSANPVPADSSPPYGDRYAATDRFQSSSVAPTSPATSASLGDPDEDDWDDEPLDDAPRYAGEPSSADRYGTSSSLGTSGSYGGAASRFGGETNGSPLSPAGHEESEESPELDEQDSLDAEPNQFSFSDDSDDADDLDNSDNMEAYEDEQYTDDDDHGGPSSQGAPVGVPTAPSTFSDSAYSSDSPYSDNSYSDNDYPTDDDSDNAYSGRDSGEESENGDSSYRTESDDDRLLNDDEDDDSLLTESQERAAPRSSGSGEPDPVRDLESGYSRSGTTSNGTPPAPRGLLDSSAPPRELPTTSSSGSTAGGSTALGVGGVTAAAAAPIPGTKDLEGAQTPSVTIEKLAPQEVQVGQAADFELVVTNVGRTPAHDVVVMDHVPQGTVLNRTEPPAERSGDALTWRLGTLQPGSEMVLKMNVTPETEGDIGSVAEVAFRAQATARTLSTRPEVVVDVRVAERVLVGEPLSLVIMVRNEGSGAARGVVIEEDVPEGFSHPAGRELENEIGLLRPSETKTLELRLQAERPGVYRNVVRVRDAGNTDLLKEQEIEITAPELEVAIQGPRLRYVERQATYEIAIRNVGTASARRVELVTNLPRGMKFISASKLGQYDARQHAVYWRLEELPPGKEGSVSLVTLPTAAGEQVLQVEGTADLGIADLAELTVRVESIAELHFTISDSADPIEVGSNTTYQIAVVNQGGKEDRNVVVVATLPDELVPTSAQGPTDGRVSGQQVEFAPVPRIAPGERLVFQVNARGEKSGDARVRIQLTSEDAPKPVVKEESTRVYSD